MKVFPSKVVERIPTLSITQGKKAGQERGRGGGREGKGKEIRKLALETVHYQVCSMILKIV